MKVTNNFVFFWETADIYSNWHPAKFRLEGYTFANSEQAMMYEKAKLMGDTASMAKILKTTNPKKVKQLGREIKPWNEKLWEKNRLPIMTKICLVKFRANPVLKQELLDTEDKIIVEASPYDAI